MSLTIKNGQIVTATDSYVADIQCEGETITAIGHDLSPPAGSDVIDATGKYVFPGFIDPHVHIYLPFMGTYAKDTYDSGSRAALVGGTTTLIEMCCPSRQEEPLEAFELWRSKADGVSACDYTYHMGVTRFDDSAEKQLREIVQRGIASFKIFLAYKGAFGIDDTELFHTLAAGERVGRDRDSPLRERDTHRGTAAIAAGRWKDRSPVARTVTPHPRGSGGCASLDDICRTDGRSCLRGAHQL